MICYSYSHITLNTEFNMLGLPEFDFDDSDHGSAQSTPSPQNQQFQTLVPFKTQSSSTYHPSLRKKKWVEKPSSQICQSTLEKSWSLQAELAQQRPVSVLTQHPSESNIIANKVAGTLLQQVWKVVIVCHVWSFFCVPVTAFNLIEHYYFSVCC